MSDPIGAPRKTHPQREEPTGHPMHRRRETEPSQDSQVTSRGSVIGASFLAETPDTDDASIAERSATLGKSLVESGPAARFVSK
jgi:hypothetical protein